MRPRSLVSGGSVGLVRSHVPRLFLVSLDAVLSCDASRWPWFRALAWPLVQARGPFSFPGHAAGQLSPSRPEVEGERVDGVEPGP